MKRAAFFVIIAMMATLLIACPNPSPSDSAASCDTVPADTVADTTQMDGKRYARLDEADYERVAAELGIDVATMKAVVEIEAGSAHQGFAAPGIPLVNFDLVVFKRLMRKAGKSYSKHAGSVAFKRVNIRKSSSCHCILKDNQKTAAINTAVFVLVALYKRYQCARRGYAGVV